MLYILPICAKILGQNHFAEPKRHVLSLLHPIFFCRATYRPPVELFLRTTTRLHTVTDIISHMWVEKLQLLRLPMDTQNSRRLVGMKKARGKRNQALFRDRGRGGIEKRNVYFFDLYFRTNLQNYLFRLCRHNNLRGGHSFSSQKTCTTLRRKEKCSMH